MRTTIPFRLLRAGLRPARPQLQSQLVIPRPANLSTASASTSVRSFASTPVPWKKSKAAAVKRAHKEAKEDADEKPEGHRYEKAAENDLDDVLDKTKKKMEKSVDWARAIVYEGVERGRGRISPALLDGIKVTTPDVPGSRSLNSVASILVKGNALLVEVWDSDHLKYVESALNEANLPGISPMKVGDSTLKLPVSRPSHEQRQEILKHIARTIETAKNQVRKARTDGLNSLGGRGEQGSDDVEKLSNKFGGDLDESLKQAKKEFEKV